MKRLLSVLMILLMIVALASCSGDKAQPDLPDNTGAALNESSEGDKDQPDLSEKAGVAPYELSQSDKELLRAFGILNNYSQIISFKAPEETESVEVRVYILREDEHWERISGASISSGEHRSPGESKGTFTMQFKDNYAIEYVLTSCGGGFSSKIEGIDSGGRNVATTYGFLKEFKEIEIDKEIPVAVMAYSFYDEGTSMRDCEPEHYFTPSVFEGVDLVRAVTLVFSDKENPPAPAQ